MNGIELIAAERKRQIKEEPFTAEYDDEYVNNELARAAATYALPEHLIDVCIRYGIFIWPWSEKFIKRTPKNRINELKKAGALCAAEIDRLLRIEKSEKKTLQNKLMK
jgi:hypothetical protein